MIAVSVNRASHVHHTPHVGFAQIMRGQEREGIETLKPLLANADTLNGFLAQVFIALGFFRDGCVSEARREAAEAVERSAFFPTAQTMALAVLGRIELDQERFDEAEVLFEAARWEADSYEKLFQDNIRALASDSSAVRNQAIANIAESDSKTLTRAASDVAFFLEDFRLADTLSILAVESAHDSGDANAARFNRILPLGSRTNQRCILGFRRNWRKLPRHGA